MEPAIVTVSFAFDLSEFERAERAVIRAVRGPWWSRWENLLWLAVLAFLAYLVWDLTRFEPATLVRAWPIPTLAVLGGFAPKLPGLYRRRLLLKDSSTQGLHVRTLGPDGFAANSNGVTLAVPWDKLVRVVETDEFFLFFHSTLYAYYIGKRRLTPADRANARAWVSARVA